LIAVCLCRLGYRGRNIAPGCRGEDSNLHWNRAVTTSLSFSLRSSRTPVTKDRGVF